MVLKLWGFQRCAASLTDRANDSYVEVNGRSVGSRLQAEYGRAESIEALGHKQSPSDVRFRAARSENGTQADFSPCLSVI